MYAVARIVARIALVGALSSLAACTHGYRLRVDALHDPLAPRGQSYRVAPADPRDGPIDEKTHARAVRLVEEALATRGMHPAPEGQPADVELAITYRVSAPRQRVSHIPDPESNSHASSPAQRLGGGPGRGPAGVVQDPIPAEHASRVRVTEVFEKELVLVARTPKRAGAPAHAPDAEIWRVQVSVESEGRQVDAILPILARTAAEHAGQDVNAKRIVSAN